VRVFFYWFFAQLTLYWVALPVGKLVKDENFTLFESVGALEVSPQSLLANNLKGL